MPVLQRAGEIDVTSVTLTNFRGQEVNILPQVAELNIYEDIFSNTMSGEVVIGDAIAIAMHLPIIGHEKITIQMETPGLSFVEVSGFVYKSSNRVHKNESTAVYVLHFCSAEMLKNAAVTVSKAYSGNASEIVSKLFEEVRHTKPVITESSKSQMKFISPYWNPFQSINWIAARAQGEKEASFLFYEDMDSFKFADIHTLAQKDPVMEYTMKNPKLDSDTNQIRKNLNTLLNFQVLESNDTLEGIDEGLMGVQEYVRSPTKNEVGYTFNKPSSTAYLNKTLPFQTTNGSGVEFEGAARTTVGYDDQSLFTDKPSSVVPLNRRPFLYRLNSTRLLASVHGFVGLTVGKTLQINIPSNKPTSMGMEYDSMLTGKYLIAGLRHSIFPTKRSHQITMELVKDSV